MSTDFNYHGYCISVNGILKWILYKMLKAVIEYSCQISWVLNSQKTLEKIKEKNNILIIKASKLHRNPHEVMAIGGSW